MSDKPATLTAADVMQVAVKTVPSTMSLSELEDELQRAKVSGFPVVDDGRLIGVVSRSDVINRISSERNVAETTSDFYFDETGFFEEKMESWKDIADRVGERLESLTVADVLVTNPFTINMNQTVSEIAERLIRHRVHRLPVIDHGTLVGIVTTTDLVRLFAEGRVAVA